MDYTTPDGARQRHGDPFTAQQDILGPSWCLDKQAVKAAVLAEFAQRGSWQGKCHESGEA